MSSIFKSVAQNNTHNLFTALVRRDCGQFRRLFCFFSWVVSAQFIFVSPPAFAQFFDSEDKTNYFDMSLEELLQVKITTSSRVEESQSETSAHVRVISQNQIRSRGYRHLEDLLQDLPGVDVNRGTRPDYYNTVTVRGITGNSKLLILQNGFRITPPAGEGIAIASNFPLYHAKQVEILYGPASVVYGADAFSAVINIITDDTNSGTDLGLSVGQDNQYAGHIKWDGQVTDGLHLSIGVNKTRYGNYDYLAQDFSDLFPLNDLFDFQGNLVVSQDDRNLNILPNESQQIFLTARHHSGLSFDYNLAEFQNSTSLGLTESVALYSASANFNADVETIALSFEHEFGEAFGTRTNIERIGYQLKPISNFVTIFSGFDTGYKYAESHETRLEQVFHYQADTLGVIAGLSYSDFHFIPRTPDLDHPFNASQSTQQQNFTYPGSTLPIQFFETNYNTRSGFLEFKNQWNKQLSSSIGIRYDDSSLYGKTSNPRFAINYNVSKGLNIKLLYGEAFLAPSPDTAFATFGEFAFQNPQNDYVSFFFQAPNLNLEPEKIETTELLLEYLLSSDLNLSLSLYDSVIENASGLTSDDEPKQFIPSAVLLNTQSWKNIGRAEIRGIDFAVDYQFDYFDTKWEINASYSHLDGDIATSESMDSELAYATKAKLKFGIVASIAPYYARLRTSWKDYVTSQQIDPNDPTKRLRIDWKSDVKFGFGRHFDDQLRAEIFVDNLLDTHRVEAGGLTGNSLTMSPQPGRRISIGLYLDF